MNERGFARRDELVPRLRDRRRGPSMQALACALGLMSSAVLGLGFLYASDHDTAPINAAPSLARLALPKPRVALVRDHKDAAPSALVHAALLDPSLTSSWEAAPFARSAPLRSRFERAVVPQVTVEAAPVADEASQIAEAELEPVPQVVQPVEVPPLVRDNAAADVPLPAPRPSFARPVPSTRYALREPPPGPAAVIAPPSDGRTLLERMFGAPSTPAPANPALAYATPGDTGTGFFGSRPAASTGTGTAVYNIALHTVTLPDGSKLEAHSGLGTSLDNPSSVTQRMRGATPPSLYELTQREALFHGVRALRLTPLLEGTTFGRGGLLAHTFMLGPRGDSNGCVVFRNYQAFLAAYDSGQVRRLLVVAGT